MLCLGWQHLTILAPYLLTKNGTPFCFYVRLFAVTRPVSCFQISFRDDVGPLNPGSSVPSLKGRQKPAFLSICWKLCPANRNLSFVGFCFLILLRSWTADEKAYLPQIHRCGFMGDDQSQTGGAGRGGSTPQASDIVEDNWSHLTDPEERRRVQNRNAQRRFRKCLPNGLLLSFLSPFPWLSGSGVYVACLNA